MAVALTNIKYGGSGKFDVNGNYVEVEPHKVIKAGDKIPPKAFSKEEMDVLRENGAVGDTSDLAEETPEEGAP
jgi:hypothetical protein